MKYFIILVNQDSNTDDFKVGTLFKGNKFLGENEISVLTEEQKNAELEAVKKIGGLVLSFETEEKGIIQQGDKIILDNAACADMDFSVEISFPQPAATDEEQNLAEGAVKEQQTSTPSQPKPSDLAVPPPVNFAPQQPAPEVATSSTESPTIVRGNSEPKASDAQLGEPKQTDSLGTGTITLDVANVVPTNQPASGAATSSPLPAGIGVQRPQPPVVANPVFDPTDAIKKYSQDKPGVKGKVRADNLLTWRAKENLSEIEKDLINYIALTHLYTTGSTVPVLGMFARWINPGDLREAIWKDAQAKNSDWQALTLEGLPKHFYDNGLKPIIDAYEGQRVGRDVAISRLENFRHRVGTVLENNDFHTGGDFAAVQRDIQDLLIGTYMPPAQRHIAVPGQ